ncbi:MAG: phosphatase PAP2 family protein [Treponema sp.]|nr:phosphatase PAP2 family protein [Treponema sp.]
MIFELFSEGKILLWIQDNLRCHFLSSILIPYTHLGDIGIFWFVLGAFFLIFKKTRKAAFLALISFGLSALLCDGCLKLIVNRVRPFDAIPELMALVERPRGTSFPSGHTTTAFGFGLAFFLNTKKRWTGWVILSLSIIMAFSRLYVGVHYPSDVLAGIIIGSLVSIIVTFVGNKIISGYSRP